VNCVVAYGYCIRKQCQWQFYVVDLDAPLGEMCTCIELVRSDDLMICWICGPYLCHRRDRRTLPAESSDRCNFTTAILNFPVTFTYPIGESRLIRRMVTFSLLYASYKYSYLLTYLLTCEFLVDNVYGISIDNTCKLLFYWKAWNVKDTQMKVYCITKLTSVLKSEKR